MKAIIVGGGLVGAYITSVLISNKIDVKVIEDRMNVFEKLKKDLPKENIVFGDGTSHAVLEACGIVDVDVLVAVTGADETNLVVSTLAKYEYGVPRVIARVNNPKNEWLFNSGMGVDAHLSQADLMSRMTLEEMDLTNIDTLMKISRSSYSIVKTRVLFDSEAKNKTVKELKLPQESLLIAINRNDTVILPRGDVKIEYEDEVIALVCEDAKAEFMRLFHQD
jgi:trk system potassium uptake protein TrkA